MKSTYIEYMKNTYIQYMKNIHILDIKYVEYIKYRFDFRYFKYILDTSFEVSNI